MKSQVGWQNEGLTEWHGKALRARNSYEFASGLRANISARCLKYVMQLSNPPVLTVLDVGCAAGDFYACVKQTANMDKIEYLGLDVSVPAIEAAVRQYPNGNFKLINGDEDLPEHTADLVFSIDVIHHQLTPLNHLRSLLVSAGKYFVTTLRTRDQGESLFDIEKSCQLVFGDWVPYFIINTHELYEKIFEYTGKPTRITAFKDYSIQGGQGTRFLPKEMYLEEIGGAVTTLFVDMTENVEKNQVIEYRCTAPSITRLRSQISSALFSSAVNIFGLGSIMARLSHEKIDRIEDVVKYHNLKSIEQDIDLSALKVR